MIDGTTEEKVIPLEVGDKKAELVITDEGYQILADDIDDFTEEEKTELEKKALQTPYVQKKNMEINKTKKENDELVKKVEELESLVRGNGQDKSIPTSRDEVLMRKFNVSTKDDLDYIATTQPADFMTAVAEWTVEQRQSAYSKHSEEQAMRSTLLNELARDGYDVSEAQAYIENGLGAKVNRHSIDAYKSTHRRVSEPLADVVADKQSKQVKWVPRGTPAPQKSKLDQLFEENLKRSGDRNKP